MRIPRNEVLSSDEQTAESVSPGADESVGRSKDLLRLGKRMIMNREIYKGVTGKATSFLGIIHFL